jgi:serine/threonine-protein kinase
MAAKSPSGLGQRLAHYRILDKLGAGGMGEVYRATDTKLGREVAIKVLPSEVVQHPARLARFEREAKLLASLNHPSIAAIYGLEEAEGRPFLVLELVEGEDLKERLGRGAIPVPEALIIARQIAEALEEAHAKGIVHRDLKPANVKLGLNGKVKVLDFGLAKAFGSEGTEAPSEELSQSPTQAQPGTAAGVILGTAAYMSPEQARGHAVDKRTDIWAFGVVLFEMLTGRRLLGGETLSDTLAAVLEREIDWKALPETTPPAVRRLLRRCLQRDKSRRLHDIADARIEIEEGPHESPPPPKREGRSRAVWLSLGALVGAVVSAALVAWAVTEGTPLSRDPVRFVIDLPSALRLGDAPSVALSPDGKRLVYAAGREAGATELFQRPLSRLEATPIPDTLGAAHPFFSPDGEWVGFFADGMLKKVPLSGGPAVTLCEAASGHGGSWGEDDTIVFSPAYVSGLLQVSATGGVPKVVINPDSETGETGLHWPEMLLGGQWVLHTVAPGMSAETKRIGALSLRTGERRVLLENASDGRYLEGGYLVFMKDGALVVAAFDLGRLEVASDVVTVQRELTRSRIGRGDFGLGRDGTLVWVPDPGPRSPVDIPDSSLVWVDRQGRAEPVKAPVRRYWAPALSPDGRRVALNIDLELWILELGRGVLTRFTFEAQNHIPVWSPTGDRIVFTSTRGGPANLYWMRADGTGEVERLTTSKLHHDAGSWSPDGKTVAFAEIHPQSQGDLWLLHLDEERRVELFLQTRFDERKPMISPDGKWLAYQSNDSGQFEIYVQPFPEGGRRHLVSRDGGSEPLWSRDGRELTYRNGGRVMAVEVETGAEFSAGDPEFLFKGESGLDFGLRLPLTYGSPNYDIDPDGRFLMLRLEPETPLTKINVVLDWTRELEELVSRY